MEKRLAIQALHHRAFPQIVGTKPPLGGSDTLHSSVRAVKKGGVWLPLEHRTLAFRPMLRSVLLYLP